MPSFPYQVHASSHYLASPRPHICGSSRTLEESIAFVRERVLEDGRDWTEYEITHPSGRRWRWVPGLPHCTFTETLDTPE